MSDERRLTLRTTKAHAGRRLDDVILHWLPGALGRPLSKAKVRRLIMAGAVRVGSAAARRPGQMLTAGRLVEARVRLDLLADRTSRDRPFTLTADRILFEDAWLIAVDKPPGLPTAPTVDPGRPSLFAAVRAHLAARSAGDAYLGLHQRLDRDTSGVVLFAKDAAVNPALATAFADHTVGKAYHALTRRPARLPARAWRASSSVGGKQAETDFALRRVLAHGLLVEARPRTGRKHQIRVHLAEAGCAVLGDDLHGGQVSPAVEVPRLMLHAIRLELAHPISGGRLVIESPHPGDFRGVLSALENREQARARRG
jgi:RluA family pseudouridine synthase